MFPDKSEALGSVHDTDTLVMPNSTVSMMSFGQFSIDGGVVSTIKGKKSSF